MKSIRQSTETEFGTNMIHSNHGYLRIKVADVHVFRKGAENIPAGELLHCADMVTVS